MNGNGGPTRMSAVRGVVDGERCEVCSVPIRAGDPCWLMIWLGPDPSGRDDELIVLGSMDCFVRWTTSTAHHYYVEHLSDGTLDDLP